MLSHQLILINRGIDFFTNTALLYRFVNVNFANTQRDNTPFFRFPCEEPLAAAVCLFRLGSDRWDCREKIG